MNVVYTVRKKKKKKIIEEKEHAVGSSNNNRSKPVYWMSEEPIDLKTKIKELENDFFYCGKDRHTKYLVASNKEFLY